MNGAPQAAIILTAALAFGGVAFQAGLPAPGSECRGQVEVVRYFPAPEPNVLHSDPGWTWPVEDRLPTWRADDAPQKAAEVAETEDKQPEHRPRHHWRRHSRRR